MRALRYFLAGFETLVALFFFCLFAGGLVATVQLSAPKNPPWRARGGPLLWPNWVERWSYRLRLGHQRSERGDDLTINDKSS
jgi:hypothetical protein